MTLQLTESHFLTIDNLNVPGRKLITTSVEFITESESKNFVEHMNGGVFKDYSDSKAVADTAKRSLYSAVMSLAKKSGANGKKSHSQEFFKEMMMKRFTIYTYQKSDLN